MANRKVQRAKKLVFELKRGVSVGGVRSDAIGSELTRIYKEDGELTTKGVVNAARPEVAPLHPAFEWDDERAGELYREVQARKLIKLVDVISTDQLGETKKTTAFVHIPDEKERAGSYHPMSVIVNQPDKFIIALSVLQGRVDLAKSALEDLKSAAKESEMSQDRMASMQIAALAMQTARDAVMRIQ